MNLHYFFRKLYGWFSGLEQLVWPLKVFIRPSGNKSELADTYSDHDLSRLGPNPIFISRGNEPNCFVNANQHFDVEIYDQADNLVLNQTDVPGWKLAGQ